MAVNRQACGHFRVYRLRLFLEVLLMALTAMFISAPYAYAETSKGNSWHAVVQENGYSLGSPEQIRAAYYLFATDGQSWWTGRYHAPSEEYVTSLIESPGWTASVIAWKTANIVFSPDEVGRYLAEFDPTDGNPPDPLGEKGYYEALLFDILYEQSYSVKLLDSLNASLKENKVDLLHTVYKQYRTSFGFDYQFGNGITDEEADVIDRCLWDQFVNDGLYSYEKKFKEYLDKVNTIEGKVERAANLLVMQDVADSQICVLEQLRDRCKGDFSLESLKAACDELLLVCDQESFGARYFIASQMFPVTLKDGLKTLYSKLWTGVTKALGGPWKTLSGAYNLGKTFCNVWLSTDAQIEKFFQMSCTMSIRQVLSQMCAEARLGYLTAPSQANAESYIAIVDMLLNVYDLELKQAEEYVSILDDATINRTLALYAAYDTHESLIAGFKSERKKMQRECEFSKEFSSEIAKQGASEHDEIYEKSSIAIANQQEFEWYCCVYQDLLAINEAWVSVLSIACTDAIAVQGRMLNIGPAQFDSLLLGDKSVINFNGETKVKSMQLVSSAMTCGSLSVDNLSVSGSSTLEVLGDATVASLTGMADGDLVRVGGTLAVGVSYSPYSTSDLNRYKLGELTGGAVEVAGDMELVGNAGYWSSGSHLTVLCGDGAQRIAGEGVDVGEVTHCRIGMLAPRNPYAEIEAPGSPIVLAEGGACRSVSCESLDLAGNGLAVAGGVVCRDELSLSGGDLSTGGDVTCSRFSASPGSRLEGACLAVGGRMVGSSPYRTWLAGSLAAEGATIALSGDVVVEPHAYGPRNSLVSSAMTCGSLSVDNLSVSGSSTLEVLGDATVASLTGMADGDLVRVGGTLAVGVSYSP